MSSMRAFVLLTLAGTLFAQPGEPPPQVRLERLKERMSARQARDLVGQPSIMARQIFSRGRLEQWIYERPEEFRLDILHSLGQEAVVKTVHRPAKQPR